MSETDDVAPNEGGSEPSAPSQEALRLAGDGEPVPLALDDTRFRAAGKGPWVAEASGFNVHAGVTICRP